MLKKIKSLASDKTQRKIRILNHVSVTDNFVFPQIFLNKIGKKPLIGAQDDLFSSFIRKFLINYNNIIFPVDRETKKGLVKLMDDTKNYVDAGENVVLYPQRHRSRIGETHYDFKRTTFRAIDKLNKENKETQIIPTSLAHERVLCIDSLITDNPYKFKFEDFSRLIKGVGKSHYHFSDPVSSFEFKDSHEMVEEIGNIIKNNVPITASNLAATAYLRSDTANEERIIDSLQRTVDNLKGHWHKFLTTGSANEVFERSAVNERSSEAEIKFYANQIAHYLEK